MKPVPLLPERAHPLLFAHRGCSSLAPENTMAAFSKARAAGSPGIELDIHVCASGELIVAHDDTFQRTAGDNRKIEDLSLAEIRSIDVGSFFSSAFHGERPPLLDEVLETFCPGMYIDIELKTRKTKDDSLPVLLADTIRRFGNKIEKSITVSSFNPFAIFAFKKICPLIPTAIIWCINPEVPFILRRGFGRFLSHCDYLKPEYAQVKRYSGFPLSVLEKRPIVPWTIDDSALAKKMLSLGCQGIITNRPQDVGMITAHGGEGKYS
jgi:glycerophosphoryl diester phosphodiesterase